MPRSAGTYTLTANAHAVSGNTISSTAFNNLIDDLAAEMTNSLPRDGTAAMTGVLQATDGTAALPSYTFGSDVDTGLYHSGANVIGVAVNGAAVGTFTSAGWVGSVTGQVNGGAYIDVASATTTDIGAVLSKSVNITGTTTITGLGTVAAGTEKSIKFAGILTFTHNATSLILPGGANITTAAGDTCEAVSLGSGNWLVRSYTQVAATVGGVPTGAVMPFAMGSVPSGWLECNGSAVSRTTYANLYAKLVTGAGFSGQTFTVTIASPAVVTKNSHGFVGGERIMLTTSGALPTGLSANTDYIVAYIDANTFNLYTVASLNSLTAPTAINTSGSQSGTHTYTRSYYGLGDNSTTFNVPDLRGEFIRGWDNTRGVDTGRNLGAWQTDLFRSHTHTEVTAVAGGNAGAGGAGYGFPNSAQTAATGGVETRPRGLAMMYCIKT